jgi:hypothetical protein
MYPAERDGGKKRMRKESSTRSSAFYADNEPFQIEKLSFLKNSYAQPKEPALISR